jgi:hypothetical protein
MCYGAPNVTTSIGAEGMSDDKPWGGLFSDKADEIANSALELYRDKNLWLQCQKNGFDIIHTVFNKREHGDVLINRITDCLNNLETNRLNNFTGTMLRHHHNKSTEYMAQWIEAKNKLIKMTVSI